MPYRNPHWLEGQRKRWLRPDAARCLKPDWRDRKYWNGAPPPDWMEHPFDMIQPVRTHRTADPTPPIKAESLTDMDACDIDTLRRELLDFGAVVAKARCDLAWRRFMRAFQHKYSPDQPRVPAGNPDGGQWTDGGAGGLNPIDGITADSTDVSAASRGRGHHYVPRELFGNKPLPAETRKVFEEGNTGRLLDNRSNRYDLEHRSYNRAVKEHFDQFIEANQIDVERMTPDQARAFFDEVKQSNDPRIRRHNMKIWLREILKRGPMRPRGDQ